MRFLNQHQPQDRRHLQPQPRLVLVRLKALRLRCRHHLVLQLRSVLALQLQRLKVLALLLALAHRCRLRVQRQQVKVLAPRLALRLRLVLQVAHRLRFLPRSVLRHHYRRHLVPRLLKALQPPYRLQALLRHQGVHRLQARHQDRLRLPHPDLCRHQRQHLLQEVLRLQLHNQLNQLRLFISSALHRLDYNPCPLGRR